MPILNNATSPDGYGVEDSLEALTELHTLSVDTLRGFETMVDKAQPKFKPVAERFSALHTRHVARLDTMVREMGGVPDVDGSLMGLANTAIVSLRAMVDDIDDDAMDRIRNGERNVLAAFDRSLEASLPQGHNEALAQMRAELSSLLDETRHVG